jgi:UDP-N-acetyl-2-amino-2-deoxyglucuronate dehydrogenase
VATNLNFALLGAAGFVAPRHLSAISSLGGELVAAMDPKDSVGILDNYFPNAHFFVEFERFDRFLDKIRRAGKPASYLTVCSPNHLHDAHIRFGLRSGLTVICEKPMVLNPWNLDGLSELEDESGCKVNSILQLRHHQVVVDLKKRFGVASSTKHDIILTYVTSRGRWYDTSWKGEVSKSGGIATNIGVHFFDMLIFIFGKPTHSELHLSDTRRMSGLVEFPNASVRWFLSIDSRDLPDQAGNAPRTFRSVSIDEEEVEFSEGFTDLHKTSYEAILKGNGFGISDVRPSIELVAELRTSPIEVKPDHCHPKAKQYLRMGFQ